MLTSVMIDHIYTLHMSTRTTNALLKAGIEEVRELSILKEINYDFKEIRGLGDTAIEELNSCIPELQQPQQYITHY